MNLGLEEARLRMVELIRGLAPPEGQSATPIPGVMLMHGCRPMARTPVIYEPGIAVLVQGRKRGYLGGQLFEYDQRNYLVTSVPMPFEVETIASPDEPLLGVKMRIELAMLAELLLEMDERLPESGSSPRGLYATPLNAAMSGTVIRLLEALADPVDARILGPQLARELLYRVLCGEQGGALRALATRTSHCGRIGKVLRRVHAEYSCELDVESLAEEASTKYFVCAFPIVPQFVVVAAVLAAAPDFPLLPQVAVVAAVLAAAVAAVGTETAPAAL